MLRNYKPNRGVASGRFRGGVKNLRREVGLHVVEYKTGEDSQGLSEEDLRRGELGGPVRGDQGGGARTETLKFGIY